MNSYLQKIHREHHEVEQWQNNHKKQQMLSNIGHEAGRRLRATQPDDAALDEFGAELVKSDLRALTL